MVLTEVVQERSVASWEASLFLRDVFGVRGREQRIPVLTYTRKTIRFEIVLYMIDLQHQSSKFSSPSHKHHHPAHVVSCFLRTSQSHDFSLQKAIMREKVTLLNVAEKLYTTAWNATIIPLLFPSATSAHVCLRASR
jgi:hypothetical protein